VYTDDNMRIVVVVEYFVSNNARDESTLCSYSHAMTPRGGHIVGSDKPFNKITHSEFQDICLRIVQAQWAGRELKEGPLQTCLCSGSHASALRGGVSAGSRPNCCTYPPPALDRKGWFIYLPFACIHQANQNVSLLARPNVCTKGRWLGCWQGATLPVHSGEGAVSRSQQRSVSLTERSWGMLGDSH
jgi:hypothetical protein